MKEDKISYYQLKQMKRILKHHYEGDLRGSLLQKQKAQNYYYASINQDKLMECPICCQLKPELLSVADCSHRFCLGCCMSHICTKAELFTDILCPDNNCKRPLDKGSNIINRLPAKTLEHIQKRQAFNYFAAHPELKPCSMFNCPGMINIKNAKKVCDKCHQPHCPKCLKAFHTGACVIDDHDKQMKAMHYQKCPNCSIWVEKQEGCNFIDCKCGVTFCYSCGVRFAEDPCRLNQIWGEQIQIRKTFLKIKYKLPESKYKYPLLAFKIPLQVMAFLLWTLAFSLISTTLVAILIGLLITLSLILIIALSCTAERRIIVLAVILLLPILTALGIILIILSFLLYPFLRRINHHGIYDGFDVAVYTATKCYLNVVVSIFN